MYRQTNWFVIPFVIITYCRLNPGAFGLKQNITVKGMIKTLKTEQEFLTLDLVKNWKFHKLLEKIKIRKNNINKKPVISGTEGKRAACPILLLIGDHIFNDFDRKYLIYYSKNMLE